MVAFSEAGKMRWSGRMRGEPAAETRFIRPMNSVFDLGSSVLRIRWTA